MGQVSLPCIHHNAPGQKKTSQDVSTREACLGQKKMMPGLPKSEKRPPGISQGL